MLHRATAKGWCGPDLRWRRWSIVTEQQALPTAVPCGHSEGTTAVGTPLQSGMYEVTTKGLPGLGAGG